MRTHPSCWPKAALAFLLTVAVTAGCGGGGGGGGGPNVAESLDPVTNPLTDDDIRHFLSRTQFASSEAGVQAVRAAGLEGYIDQMLVFQVGTGLETAAIAEVAALNSRFLLSHPNRNDLSRYWTYLMVNNTSGFQEEMALFWHDHFGVSQDVLSADERGWMFQHIDLLRGPAAVGNIRDFIHLVAINWVMLDFLDGIRSQERSPNENFARELWELFTLGRDNGYTQQDIEEASRALTGYRRRYDAPSNLSRIEFDETRHDDTDKTIFGLTLPGRTGPAGQLEYRDVVDLTFDNRPAMEFIAKKLWEYFVYENPSDALVAKLAKSLRDNNENIGAFMKTVFLSKAFYTSRAKAGLVKNPIQHGVGFSRTTGIQIPLNFLDGSLAATGQRPTQPPSVNGWPSGSLWLAASAMVERANLIRIFIMNRPNPPPQTDPIVDALLPPPAQRSPGEVLDALATHLRVTLSDPERTEYITYLDTDRDPSGNVIQDPFDGNDPFQVDMKVRGLLYILAQHPTYHIR